MLLNICFHQFQPFRVHKIRFGQGYNAPGDAVEMQDLHMFLGLGHPAVICCNHQENEIHLTHSGEHILDQAVVTWDIYYTDITSGKGKPGET